MANHLYHVANLVDGAAFVVGPRAPLLAVDGTKVAVLVGPFVPDAHPVGLQIGYVCVAAEEPQQFVDDGFQVQLLGSEQRKALVQVEAHLVSEDAFGAGAGAVGLHCALVEYALE